MEHIIYSLLANSLESNNI